MSLGPITPLPGTVFTVQHLVNGGGGIGDAVLPNSVKFTKTFIYSADTIRVSIRLVTSHSDKASVSIANAVSH
ncbi:MAG: hypothetical protein AAGU17_13565 [Anaerolineaceae bacterium]